MFSRMPECRQDIFEFQFVARPVFLCALDRPSMRLICCQGLALFFLIFSPSSFTFLTSLDVVSPESLSFSLGQLARLLRGSAPPAFLALASTRQATRARRHVHWDFTPACVLCWILVTASAITGTRSGMMVPLIARFLFVAKI